jgi:hypothetical protein
MATTSKSEKIFVGNDNEVIELTGKDKEAFLAEKAEIKKQELAQQTQTDAQKDFKISAYTKLGLTEKEINAIL